MKKVRKKALIYKPYFLIYPLCECIEIMGVNGCYCSKWGNYVYSSCEHCVIPKDKETKFIEEEIYLKCSELKVTNKGRWCSHWHSSDVLYCRACEKNPYRKLVPKAAVMKQTLFSIKHLYKADTQTSNTALHECAYPDCKEPIYIGCYCKFHYDYEHYTSK